MRMTKTGLTATTVVEVVVGAMTTDENRPLNQINTTATTDQLRTIEITNLLANVQTKNTRTRMIIEITGIDHPTNPAIHGNNRSRTPEVHHMEVHHM